MDTLLGLLGRMLGSVVFTAIFFWPGWLALNILTLGRYPRVRGPRRNVDDLMEVEMVSIVGVMTVIALIALAGWLWPAS